MKKDREEENNIKFCDSSHARKALEIRCKCERNNFFASLALLVRKTKLQYFTFQKSIRFFLLHSQHGEDW
jgi:hypothetical protein